MTPNAREDLQACRALLNSILALPDDTLFRENAHIRRVLADREVLRVCADCPEFSQWTTRLHRLCAARPAPAPASPSPEISGDLVSLATASAAGSLSESVCERGWIAAAAYIETTACSMKPSPALRLDWAVQLQRLIKLPGGHRQRVLQTALLVLASDNGDKDSKPSKDDKKHSSGDVKNGEVQLSAQVAALCSALITALADEVDSDPQWLHAALSALLDLFRQFPSATRPLSHRLIQATMALAQHENRYVRCAASLTASQALSSIDDYVMALHALLDRSLLACVPGRPSSSGGSLPDEIASFLDSKPKTMPIVHAIRQWDFLCGVIAGCVSNSLSSVTVPIGDLLSALERLSDVDLRMEQLRSVSTHGITPLALFGSLPHLHNALLETFACVCHRLGRRLLPHADRIARVVLARQNSTAIGAAVAALGASAVKPIVIPILPTLLPSIGEHLDLISTILTHCGTHLRREPVMHQVQSRLLSLAMSCKEGEQRLAAYSTVHQALVCSPDLAFLRICTRMFTSGQNDPDALLAAVCVSALQTCNNLAASNVPVAIVPEVAHVADNVSVVQFAEVLVRQHSPALRPRNAPEDGTVIEAAGNVVLAEVKVQESTEPHADTVEVRDSGAPPVDMQVDSEKELEAASVAVAMAITASNGHATPVEGAAAIEEGPPEAPADPDPDSVPVAGSKRKQEDGDGPTVDPETGLVDARPDGTDDQAPLWSF
ncbi:Pre-rRNA-processing protein RIX1 N-terminal domain-containing protein [Plasmodiophora brassicae]|uniref:Pre-rRNA-processing protein RIX1 N-terminal domain-containing protein n=1 Tax=Plasmodiophora brassicae TaxID=37360 RepID=A0A0G4IL63_PLABS|nr:hypothetical protein PBRA_004545 [Plasmodiophora brassicae]SPR00110.1 unnamed protein product [Plasmodiophora brassicae]